MDLKELSNEYPSTFKEGAKDRYQEFFQVLENRILENSSVSDSKTILNDLRLLSEKISNINNQSISDNETIALGIVWKRIQKSISEIKLKKKAAANHFLYTKVLPFAGLFAVFLLFYLLEGGLLSDRKMTTIWFSGSFFCFISFFISKTFILRLISIFYLLCILFMAVFSIVLNYSDDFGLYLFMLGIFFVIIDSIREYLNIISWKN